MSTLVDFSFKECASCAAKPGSPELCGSCLHNRTALSRLTKQVEDVCATSLRFRDRLLKAEKAIAKARKLMRLAPDKRPLVLRPEYRALAWRNR